MTEGQKQYQEYLKSDWWEEVKKDIHKRHPNCQICRKPYNLDIHHIDYSNRGNTKEWRDVRRLCHFHHRTCHRLLWFIPIPLKKRWLLSRYYYLKFIVFTGYLIKFIILWLYDNFYINSGSINRRPRKFFQYK